MLKRNNYSLLNCIATAMIAYFCMVPLHELFHLLTYYAYGEKCRFISSFSVGSLNTVDFMAFPTFHRIMATGGSASILNIIIAVILLIILLKVQMGPTMRVFLTQYMGLHWAEGFGYFMMGGMMKYGDWGVVLSYFPDNPAFAATLRIILLIIGCAGAIAQFFILNYMSYYFIENPADKIERRTVGAKLHLSVFFVGVVFLLASLSQNPSIKNGTVSMVTGLVASFMFIGFVWGFLFTGFLVKPPRKSRFLYTLPKEPHFILYVIGVAVFLVNTFILGPGIYLN